MAKVFFSYSHHDKKIRSEIDKHFSVLKRASVIETWYDNEILAGDSFDHIIKEELENADIILLLVSADFLNSNYCQDVEMKRALQKHRTGEAKVVPIIVDICDWKHTSLKTLKVLPSDGKEITKHGNRKEAYQDITNEIRELASIVNEPVGYYVKKAFYNSQKNLGVFISVSKRLLKFILDNFKPIGILLIIVFVLSSLLEKNPSKYEIEESSIFFEEEAYTTVNWQENWRKNFTKFSNQKSIPSPRDYLLLKSPILPSFYEIEPVTKGDRVEKIEGYLETIEGKFYITEYSWKRRYKKPITWVYIK